MMNQNNIKTLLAVIGLLLIGFVTGFFTQRYLTMQRIQALSNLRFADGFQTHLLNVIDATDEQEEVLKPIIKEFSMKMASLHVGFRQQRRSTIDSLHESLKGHLTQEQIEGLDYFTKRFKGPSRRNKKFKKRRNREKNTFQDSLRNN